MINTSKKINVCFRGYSASVVLYDEGETGIVQCKTKDFEYFFFVADNSSRFESYPE